MCTVEGYVPLDGDVVRIVAATGVHLEGVDLVGLTGTVKWYAEGTKLGIEFGRKIRPYIDPTQLAREYMAFADLFEAFEMTEEDLLDVGEVSEIRFGNNATITLQLVASAKTMTRMAAHA